MGLFEVLFLIAMPGFAVLVYFSILNHIEKKENLEDLLANGFEADPIMKGSPADVAVDMTQRIVAFIYAKHVKEVTFDKIMGCHHTYIETNRTVQGVGRSSIENNAIEFTLKDPSEPLLRISVSSYSYGKEWVARLSAILND